MKRAILVLLVACRGGHSGGEADHHDHAAQPAGELPGQSVTVWADRVELFMEYRPLIVGRETAFAAHVTEMPSFKPVTAGTITLTLKYADGAPVASAGSPVPARNSTALPPRTTGPAGWQSVDGATARRFQPR